VVTPCGRGSRPGGRHATRGPTQVGLWWLQAGMVSLPGWGGPWERRERLGSDGSDISKKRYNLGHPGVQQTMMHEPNYCSENAPLACPLARMSTRINHACASCDVWRNIKMLRFDSSRVVASVILGVVGKLRR